MSEGYQPGAPAETHRASDESTGTVDAAKQEAADLKDTATAEASRVVDTVKDEASAVVGEAKTQAKDLYAQTQRELKDQAGVQQQRVAAGLRSVGDELDAMASRSENGGVATDLVRQASTRLSSVASWLGDRDPGSVLAEVKSYARRKPGTFIAVAAIAGLTVGRLTRALAANASDDSVATPSPSSRQATTAVPSAATGSATVGSYGTGDVPAEDTPVFAQSSAARGTGFAEEGTDDVRSDTF